MNLCWCKYIKIYCGEMGCVEEHLHTFAFDTKPETFLRCWSPYTMNGHAYPKKLLIY